MYGPAPTPPTQNSAVRVWLVFLRVTSALIALGSLGLLSWLPMLLPALVHRRLRDWLLFGASLAVTLADVMVVNGQDDGSVRTNVCVVILLGQAALVSAYVAAVRLTPRQAPPASGPPGYPPVWYGHPVPAPPHPSLPAVPNQRRVDQVRSGLDELSAYLKQQDPS